VVKQGPQVGGERVVVVACRGLAGLAEAATVVGDRAVPGVEQRALLALPRAAVQGVAVDQDDRAAVPVILVVELDVRAVLGPDGDEWHLLSFVCGLSQCCA